MAKSRITFTDGVGAATLQSDYPIPACRFQGWTPKSNPQGQATTAQEDSARAMNRTSWRYGVTFSVHGLGMGAAAGSALDIADRLVGHLLAGGTCAVYTEDVLGTSYATCGLMPGTTPDITQSDDRHLDYSLSLSLINLATSPVPMLAYYGSSFGVRATGGTVSDEIIDGVLYRTHVFTASDDFVVTRGGEIEYLGVGGGATGARNSSAGSGVAAGGGAGGEVIEGTITVDVGTHAVVVAAGATGPTTVRNGFDGDDSTALGLVAKGGGAGVWQLFPDGKTGGNGGGAGAQTNTSGAGGVPLNANGFRGGNGNGTATTQAGGGGGGAGEHGGDAVGTTPGKGGDGRVAAMDGVRYGAGGGGQSSTGALGAGGAGGGTAAGSPSLSAAANTGAGTGASVSGQPGHGGSGIWKFRYRV